MQESQDQVEVTFLDFVSLTGSLKKAFFSNKSIVESEKLIDRYLLPKMLIAENNFRYLEFRIKKDKSVC